MGGAHPTLADIWDTICIALHVHICLLHFKTSSLWLAQKSFRNRTVGFCVVSLLNSVGLSGFYSREKEGDLTQSYDKTPNTNRKFENQRTTHKRHQKLRLHTSSRKMPILGQFYFLESDFRSDFGAMTSRRLGAVATAYGVADSGTVLFLESDFRSMTSRRLVVVATTYVVADSGPFWCRGVSL